MGWVKLMLESVYLTLPPKFCMINKPLGEGWGAAPKVQPGLKASDNLHGSQFPYLENGGGCESPPPYLPDPSTPTA